MIKGRVVGAEVVELKLRQAPARAMAALRKSVRMLAFELEAIIKTQTLTGLVLHRQSGDLARSVNTRFLSTPTSETGSVGTNKSYGRAWQLGFHVPAREIRPTNGQALFWPGAAHPVAVVRQKARDMAPRPFLTVGLDIIRPRVAPTIQRDVQAAIMSPGAA